MHTCSNQISNASISNGRTIHRVLHFSVHKKKQYLYYPCFSEKQEIDSQSAVLLKQSLKENTNKKIYQLVLTVVMKNCEPLESGPEFAIDKTPVQHKKTENPNRLTENFLNSYFYFRTVYRRRRSIRVFKKIAAFLLAWSNVFQFKVLIRKFITINRFPALSITMSEIASLDHKAGNNPVERSSFVMKRLSAFSNSLFP